MRSRGRAHLTSRLAFGLALALGLAVGCGTTVNNNVEGPVVFSIGGQVIYDASLPVQALSGVTVKVAAPGGAITTATTDSAGLWSMTGFAPGVYTATFTLAGYQTVMSPFPVTLQNGTQLFDGVGGNSLHYSLSGNGAITITFPYRVNFANATLTDQNTSKQIDATFTSGNMLVFSKSQIDNMNNPGPISLTGNNTWDPIPVTALGFTPIHGLQQNFSATANIKVGL